MSARGLRAAASVVGTLAVTIASAAVAAGPATAVAENFTQPGEYQSTAPPGAQCATFVIDGAHGGAANVIGPISNAGGAGGEVVVTVPTTEGMTFTLVLGGRGEDASATAPGAGGSNGGGSGGRGVDDAVGKASGGGGGGASSVAVSGATIAVAGGGGGGAPDARNASAGGQGGGGDPFTVPGGVGRAGAHGGDALLGSAKGGDGGSGTAGGAGGAAGGPNATAGTDGGAGVGGDGGESIVYPTGAGGGGGGAGYFGGGGGGGGDAAAIPSPAAPGGGGGGGSSFASSSAAVTFGVAPGSGDGAIAVTFSSEVCPPTSAAPPESVTVAPQFTG
jgi:hypothetical protein